MAVVLMNLGAGPVESATLKKAWKNIRAFRRELSKRTGHTYKLNRIVGNHGKGRYTFAVSRNDLTCVIDIPGCDFDLLISDTRVDTPRMYVDGSSWYWRFGIEIVGNFLGDKPYSEW